MTVRQRGAALLGLTVLLLAVAALWVFTTGRILLLEQRSAANLARSAQAFEAAEAGLAWALAGLNGNRRMGADCRATSDATAQSFRSTFLRLDATTGFFIPTGRDAVCTRADQAWSCRCPAPPWRGENAPPAPTLPVDATDAPSFRVSFLPADHAGVVRVQADGCTSDAGPCATASPTRHLHPDAQARHTTAYALLSGLPVPPDAALTARGSVAVAEAPLVLANPDPATGLAVRTGGRYGAPRARLIGPAGTPRDRLVAAGDSALRDLSPDRFFSGPFGNLRDDWARLPTVEHVDCSRAADDCGPALRRAVDDRPDATLIQMDGDVRLRGPLELGAPDRPVILVVRGSAQLEGEVRLHGVLQADSVRWDGRGPPGGVRGALVLAGDYAGDAAPEIVRDAAILDHLRLRSGGFVPVSGAWRDFTCCKHGTTPDPPAPA